MLLYRTRYASLTSAIIYTAGPVYVWIILTLCTVCSSSVETNVERILNFSVEPSKGSLHISDNHSCSQLLRLLNNTPLALMLQQQQEKYGNTSVGSNRTTLKKLKHALSVVPSYPERVCFVYYSLILAF